jgi:hypothetical protein
MRVRIGLRSVAHSAPDYFEDTNRETLIRDLMDDQYGNPARIVAFNTAQGWSRDVTMDIADELRRLFVEYDDVPASVQEFLEAASRAR